MTPSMVLWPGAVAVVEEVLGLGVVDGDDRQLEHAVLFHGPQADHAGRRLFHAGDDVGDQGLARSAGLSVRRPLRGPRHERRRAGPGR